MGSSRFAQTCTRLSRYIKEKGLIGIDIAATAPLLPNLNAQVTHKPADQLTIFYSGQVIVFDDFPAEKVNELVATAGQWCPPTYATFDVHAVDGIAEASPTVAAGEDQLRSDLPIARRASLNRFLEKRKDRMSSRAPYQVVVNNSHPSSSSSAATPPSHPPAKPVDTPSEKKDFNS